MDNGLNQQVSQTRQLVGRCFLNSQTLDS